MIAPDIARLGVGTALEPWELPPLTRATLALYAGGSGDHVPLHIDTDFATREAGMDDVIGHGMLTMAYLGRYLLTLAPQRQIKSFSTRFLGMSRIGDAIGLSATITRNEIEGMARLVEAELTAARANGDKLATGTVRWMFEIEEQDHGD